MISLGSTCSVAYQLQKHLLRTCALPFDWIKVDSLSKINNVLENDFHDYILSVKEVSTSEKFSLVEDDEVPEESNNEEMHIMENKYGIRFSHDFSKGYNLDKINEKYQRRIVRFKEILATSEEITFIRDELNINKIDIKDIECFLELIKKIYNVKVKYKMVINNYKKKEINYDIFNEIKELEIYEDIQKYEYWTRPNVDWLKIFNT